MRLVVAPMELDDVPEVLEVDRESYTLPWPASAYRREILHNRTARYLVLREVLDDGEGSDDRSVAESRPRLPLPFFRWPLRGENRSHRGGRILGYAGMWLMVDEAHITTIAIREAWRGRGLGELLLASLIEQAMELQIRRVTLEVRVSNATAQNLYRKYGFQQEGVRPRYYSDNNEDAYIMTTGKIADPSYQMQFEDLVKTLHSRLVDSPEVLIAAPPFSRAGETGNVD